MTKDLKMKRLSFSRIGAGIVVLLASSILLTGGPWSRAFAAVRNDPVAARYFKVGTGYADVIPRQIVRTQDGRVYIFAGRALESTNILVYWTTVPGVPASAADFQGSTQL